MVLRKIILQCDPVVVLRFVYFLHLISLHVGCRPLLVFQVANHLSSSPFLRDFWNVTRLVLMKAEGCSNVKVTTPLGPVRMNSVLEHHPLALIPPFIPLFSSGGRTGRAGIDASLLIRAQSVMQTRRLSGTGPLSILHNTALCWPRRTDNTTGLAGYWSANKRIKMPLWLTRDALCVGGEGDGEGEEIGRWQKEGVSGTC